MNSLEFYLAVKWLSSALPGAKVEKRQLVLVDGSFGIEFYSRSLQGRKTLVLGKGVLGFREIGEEEKGDAFSFGRQFLYGRTVSSAGQVGFDRIFRIDLSGGCSIVSETFDGNLLVLEEGIIKFVSKPREWSGRRLFTGEKYLPPKGPSKLPMEISESDLGEPFGPFLAKNLGMGPEVSGIVLELAGKSGPPDRSRVVRALHEIFSREPTEPIAGRRKESETPPLPSKEEEKRLARISALRSQIEKLGIEIAEEKQAGEEILSDLPGVEEELRRARAGEREFDRKTAKMTLSLPLGGKD